MIHLDSTALRNFLQCKLLILITANKMHYFSTLYWYAG